MPFINNASPKIFMAYYSEFFEIKFVTNFYFLPKQKKLFDLSNMVYL